MNITMVENADWVCLIHVEYKESTNQWFLAFKRVKMRMKDIGSLSFFNHPFAGNSKIQLLDDFNLPAPLSVASIADTFSDVEENNSKGRRSAVKRHEIDDMVEESLFDFDNYKAA